MKKQLLLCALLLAATASPLVSVAQKEKAPKEKKEKAPPRTVEQIVADLGETKKTGDVEIDVFVVSSVEMAQTFKKMSDDWVNIKIEVIEIEDEGDGVTTAVKITDPDGNPRDKAAVQKANGELALNLTKMAVDAAAMGLTGTSIVQGIVANPMRAISLAFAVKQMKLCIEALVALGREVPVFAENVKKQNELLAQSKQI